MLHRRTFTLAATALAALVSLPALAEDTPLRVLVHSSFSLPKPLLAQFEAESGVKLSLIKAGDAGEMLNKLILTRAQPIADLVFGLDNALVAKAQAAKVLEPLQYSQGSATAQIGANVVPVDYGFVNLNFDKAAFAKSGLALPKSLEDLTLPAYRNLLVVPNPATSSPGYAFLLATIAGMGEEKAFDWWARMRGNGVKAVKGWTEAYYTEFSRNGGSRPLVVSYASSPAAEVFYSKEKITESPTGNLFLKGGVFRQVEGVALVAGGGQREAAGKFIRFMRSGGVQEALQTSMWMYPIEAHTPLADVMKHAVEPTAFDSLPAETIADKGTGWVARWTQVVLK
ncbi:MAG: thiamine ABC transporter substrate-binding protein [Rhodoferax sp.]|uniref:thiamine ABC transporter substrate-binding protein n=1 Tax=Rhodoferax sp. TaxID=50421 RepID=UPI003266128D